MSDNKGPVYRKQALEHISKPAALDDALRVVWLRHWVSLAIIFLFLAAFFVWLIWGKIFIRVNGKGLLLSVASSIVTVQASEQGGIVKKILVKPGDHVHRKMALIRMDSDLSLQLKLQKTYLSQLKEQQADLAQRAKKVIADLEIDQTQQVLKINQSLQAAQEKLKQLDTMLGLKEKALKKGIIDLPNVTETRIEYYKLLQEIRSHEAGLIAMKANMIDLRDKWRERQRDLSLTVHKAEYDYNLLLKRWQEASTIFSPGDGVIAEIRVKEEDLTKAGEPLLTIVPANNDLYAIVFVPAIKGKLIKIGMPAQIAPTIINKLEYGTIKGTVESISLLPVTQESMMSLLRNQQLVTFFSVSMPLMTVKIKLERSNKTASGYAWTSSSGPDLHLTQGTVVETMISVESKRPIDLLLHVAD